MKTFFDAAKCGLIVFLSCKVCNGRKAPSAAAVKIASQRSFKHGELSKGEAPTKGFVVAQMATKI